MAIMTDPALDALLARREALEHILANIDIGLLVFGIFVVIGVGGESIFGIRAWLNNRKLHTVQQAIEDFRQAEAANFNKQAAEANERAAKADKSAAEAKLALERLRAPRRLLNADKLVVSLKEFKDTEYTFSSVFADEESIGLLRQVDALLHSAGWKRVKPAHAFPSINVYGDQVDFSVPSALTSGLQISINSSESLAALQARPMGTLPGYIRAAIALNLNLAENLFPPQEENGGPRVNVESGDSSIVRISVGKKP